MSATVVPFRARRTHNQASRTLTLPYRCGTVKGSEAGSTSSVPLNAVRAKNGPMSTSRHQQIMRTFGKRLKAAREQAGYSSAQKFAGVANLEPHAYRKYERGESEPRLEVIIRLCELLGVTTDYLLPVPTKSLSNKDDSGSQSAVA